MNAHEQLIHRLYESMNRHDGEGMARCYTADATFSDPVFPGLQGEQVGRMWRMLCARGKDLRVEVSALRLATDSEGSAHWEAWYTFSGTGRKVHNVIEARYTFRDGLIASHVDHFDLWRWTRQALGVSGALLGWTPLLRQKVRARARAGLEAWRG